MYRHCSFYQLCVAPLQVRRSVELHFVIGSSKRIRYFDWSRELVLRIGYFTRALALGIRYCTRATALEIGYLKLSAAEPTLAGTRFFKRVEPRFRFSIWNPHWNRPSPVRMSKTNHLYYDTIIPYFSPLFVFLVWYPPQLHVALLLWFL